MTTLENCGSSMMTRTPVPLFACSAILRPLIWLPLIITHFGEILFDYDLGSGVIEPFGLFKVMFMRCLLTYKNQIHCSTICRLFYTIIVLEVFSLSPVMAKTPVIFSQAFEKLGSGEKNRGLIYSLNWLERIENKYFKRLASSKVQELEHKYQQKMLEMDLQALFEIVPYGLGSTRHMVLKGREIDKGFHLGLGPDLSLPQDFKEGEFDLLVRVQKDIRSESKRYLPEIKLNMGLGMQKLPNYFDFWQSWLSVSYNILKQKINLLDTFALEFPQTMAFLKRYFQIEISGHNLTQDFSLMIIDFKSIIKKQALVQAYPNLYKYLWNLDDLFKGQGRFEDLDGDEWVNFQIDTQKGFFYSKFALNENNFTPLAVSQKKFWPKNSSWSGALYMDAEVKFQGVRPTIKKYRLPLLWKKGEDRSYRAILEFGHTPEISFESNFFTFIPVFFARKVMSLERDARKFFELLGHFDKIQTGGIQLQVNATGPTLLNAKMGLTFEESFLIQLGLELITQKINPSSDVQNEMQNWIGEGIKSLKIDLKNLMQ